MELRKPTINQLKEIAKDYYLELTDKELAEFQDAIENSLESYKRLSEMHEPKLEVKYPRTPGYRPGKEENKLGAWYWKTSVKGNPNGGLLSGKKIALKDNVSLAGVPLMNGSSSLDGFVPDEDATIVTRILDEGGEIVGKAVCEELCFSGNSHTSKSSVVLNPHDPTRSPGGSSTGSGALVAAGEVDMAIGGDQGGSIRIPSSWTGIFGLKPTYGLVPYTGVLPIESTIDHTGPMARTVEDIALLLTAIAGDDGLDPRQTGLEKKDYTGSLKGHAKNIKVGIVKEGFDWEGVSEKDVDELVLQAAYSLKDCGAEVEEISIPMHRDGEDIWTAISTEGALVQMIRGNGLGANWKGHYSTKFLDVFGNGRKIRANDFADTVKLVILLGEYLQKEYNGRFYAIGQNLRRTLKQAYDNAFAEYDVLIMPTVPFKAIKIPQGKQSAKESINSALGMCMNTAPFDVTGHPAMNVPCGKSNNLPVGMMIIGRTGEDDTVIQVAHAFEQLNKTKVTREFEKVNG